MQVMRLPARAPVASPVAKGGSALRVRGLVIAHAEPKVSRTFRENEDGSLEDVSAPTQAGPASPQGPLYADQVAQVPRKKDNMSKEMKQRLTKEYTGLGGAENVAFPSPRQPMVVAMMTVEERTTDLQPTTRSPAPQQIRSSKWKIDENEVLKSTWEHRLWTWASMGLMGATLAQGLLHAQTGQDWLGITTGLVAAYVLSDLGTGIYHHGVDNYGGAQTPIFGRQIAAFQGHHQRPWTITEREFCNNVHQVFKPAAFPAAVFLLASPWNSPAFNAFISSFIFLVCMSQQFHAWSHMKKSELPQAVVMLQDAGVLISRKMHGAHHRAPFEGNYCIVSGWWNPLLDSTHFFRGFEKFIHATTGVEPRCWHDPEHDWAEQERPSAST